MKTIKKYVCECGKEFENPQSFNGHKSHCKTHLKATHKLADFENRKIKYINNFIIHNVKTHTESISKKALLTDQWISEKHTCEKCGKIMTEKFGSGRFCSKACANSRVQSKKTREKISKKLTSRAHVQPNEAYVLYNKNPKICKCCGKAIPYERRKLKCCSNDCAHTLQIKGSYIGGQHAAVVNSEVRRSKNEIYFCQLCEKYFNKVRHNEAIFNGWDADVIIEDIKYAILWNGPWHYKKITRKHAVEQVQNRDAIKIKEIKNCGYIPYIIKDEGKYNPIFVEEQFQEFIKIIS